MKGDRNPKKKKKHFDKYCTFSDMTFLYIKVIFSKRFFCHIRSISMAMESSGLVRKGRSKNG